MDKPSERYAPIVRLRSDAKFFLSFHIIAWAAKSQIIFFLFTLSSPLQSLSFPRDLASRQGSREELSMKAMIGTGGVVGEIAGEGEPCGSSAIKLVDANAQLQAICVDLSVDEMLTYLIQGSTTALPF